MLKVCDEHLVLRPIETASADEGRMDRRDDGSPAAREFRAGPLLRNRVTPPPGEGLHGSRAEGDQDSAGMRYVTLKSPVAGEDGVP